MLLNRLQALWYPDRFQGWGRNRRYFEGWYFKLVTDGGRDAIAVIPGISYDANGQGEAFIQVMDGKACRSYFHSFPHAAFQASKQQFEVDIAGNHFSADEISLQLPGLSGKVQFGNRQPWPKMLGAPGIMGWYSFVPFMECKHGVVSLDHGLKGALQYQAEPNGALQQLNFEGGRGYIEKDWGRSFPRAYVWAQSNHFEEAPGASLMASVAHIPWLGSYFIGCICGFWFRGRLYRFATYTGAKHSLSIDEGVVTLRFTQPGSALHIRARQAPGAELVSPLSGEMRGKIQESLSATLEVALYERGKLIFEGAGRHAGLELAGALEVLTV